MQKTLQVIGVVALVGWTALGLFAWSNVNEHVSITIADGEGGGSDEELVLLGDQVATLSSDLDALITSLDANFELMAATIEEQMNVAAGVRSEERLRQLEAALPKALEARETAGALREVLARLEALERATSARVAPALDPSRGATTQPGEAARNDERDEPEIVAGADDASASPETPAAAEPAETKRSFLSFDLPSRDFTFEGRQRFEILSDLSRVGFDAKSTLHDFSGVSNAVVGHFVTDLARAEAGIEGRVAIASKSLSTDLEGRDENMREELSVNEFPEIVLVPTGFEPKRVDAAKKELDGTLLGSMTIRGVTKDVRVPVAASIDESRRLVIVGEAPLLLSDYGVEAPSQLGMINMEDEVKIWLHLRARARAAEAKR